MLSLARIKNQFMLHIWAQAYVFFDDQIPLNDLGHISGLRQPHGSCLLVWRTSLYDLNYRTTCSGGGRHCGVHK